MTLFGSHQVPEADAYMSYFNLTTPDVMQAFQSQGQTNEDTYFCYDPFSQEFVWSVFPSSEHRFAQTRPEDND
jgi:hypothetical protein